MSIKGDTIKVLDKRYGSLQLDCFRTYPSDNGKLGSFRDMYVTLERITENGWNSIGRLRFAWTWKIVPDVYFRRYNFGIEATREEALEKIKANLHHLRDTADYLLYALGEPSDKVPLIETEKQRSRLEELDHNLDQEENKETTEAVDSPVEPAN